MADVSSTLRAIRAELSALEQTSMTFSKSSQQDSDLRMDRVIPSPDLRSTPQKRPIDQSDFNSTQEQVFTRTQASMAASLLARQEHLHDFRNHGKQISTQTLSDEHSHEIHGTEPSDEFLTFNDLPQSLKTAATITSTQAIQSELLSQSSGNKEHPEYTLQSPFLTPSVKRSRSLYFSPSVQPRLGKFDIATNISSPVTGNHPQINSSGTFGGVSTLDLLRKRNESTPLSSSCDSIDRMLNGGLWRGEVTEICGLPGSGKTNLALQFSVLATAPLEVGGWDAEVLYIDTMNNPIMDRSLEMMHAIDAKYKVS